MHRHRVRPTGHDLLEFGETVIDLTLTHQQRGMQAERILVGRLERQCALHLRIRVGVSTAPPQGQRCNVAHSRAIRLERQGSLGRLDSPLRPLLVVALDVDLPLRLRQAGVRSGKGRVRRNRALELGQRGLDISGQVAAVEKSAAFPVCELCRLITGNRRRRCGALGGRGSIDDGVGEQSCEPRLQIEQIA